MKGLGRDNLFYSSDNERRAEELKAEMIFKVSQDMEHVLEHLHIDWEKDPSMKETPQRVARLLVEVMRGRFEPKPEIKDFENSLHIDQLYTVGPIEIRSMCSHHLVPIIGEAWYGIIPNEDGRLLGLSKFARLADWIFARPHMQEEATKMLADEVEALTNSRGLAVMVRAKHMCTVWRGVKQSNSSMITTDVRGVLRTDASAKNEFIQTVKGLGF